ncbi:hypothetical protein ACE103_06245 [Bradyrhizobium sp. ma5]|uniref:hypothetical protein n=1 Tax=Bradyrhizobium sp. ma5 TaxID=3344828 RepID=UPI0035D49999
MKIYARRGHDWSKRFKKIANDAWHISAASAINDGKLVVPSPSGVRCPRFGTASIRPAPAAATEDVTSQIDRLAEANEISRLEATRRLVEIGLEL